MDTLLELPRLCDVELSGSDLNLWQRDFEGILMKRFSHFLSNNLSSLEIKYEQPISKPLLASLVRTKKLHLILTPNKDLYNENEKLQAKYITEGIGLMPSLEELSLEKLPLLRVPKTLRRLSLIGRNGFFPEPEFFVTISQNTVLQDLRLSFTVARLRHQTSEFSSTELSILDRARLPDLEVLQICASRHSSKLLTRFCEVLLRVCNSPRELKLSGVGLTDEIILRTTTTSLRKVMLIGRPTPPRFPLIEVGAGPAETVELIQWSTFGTLLKRNPNVSDLQLSFNLRLPPLTYADIEWLSSHGPRLDYVELYSIITDDETVGKLRRNKMPLYALEWLYTRGSAREDKFIKYVISHEFVEEDGEAKFTLSLLDFRELKDTAARWTKKRVAKKARRGRMK